MEIRITETAKEAIKEKLDKKGDKYGVRVYISGLGWGGPTFGLALDEPKNNDKVQEVEGIKIILDEEISGYVKGFVIDYRNSFFGKRFAVDQLYSTSSCR